MTFFEQGVASLIANTLVLPFQVAVTTVLTSICASARKASTSSCSRTRSSRAARTSREASCRRRLTACVIATPAAPAAAEAVDRATYQRLVNAADRDASALSRLRGVTAVDGRPVDLQRVLTGSPALVDARLAVLRTGPGDPRGAAAARRSAAAILAGPDYRPEQAGVLARALSWLARLLSIPPGADGALGLIVLGGLVAAVAALIALVLGSARRVRRRERLSARAEGRWACARRARRSSSGGRRQPRPPVASRRPCACNWPLR